MGVPKFYRWISERYPCLSEVVKEYQVPEFDNLYLDMNGIIHVCSHPNDDDPHFRITEEQIFKDIFHYIEVLFRIIRPSKVFFMAVDGVAPRAKMNQQRGRRFRSAKEAEENIQKALKKGEKLPDEKRFDSNCITPGTKFMVRLQEQLKYMVHSKITTDPAWQGIRIYLSGHETPGEGEHKITEFIRYERSQPDYDPNTRHCLYGLDADLMMLGLCSHEPHFSLLREEVRFTGKKNKNARTQKAEETTFHLLHLSLMREYIDHEFGCLKKTLPFEYNLESIIDDWVLMGFLVGNDFIPHLPQLHIAHNALPMLYKTYMTVLPTLDGYINEDGIVNLSRFEKYLEVLAKFDTEKFEEHYADFRWLESKRGKSKGKDKTSKSSKVDSSSQELDSFSSLEEHGGAESEKTTETKSLKVVKELSQRQGLTSPDLDAEAKETQDEKSIFNAEFKMFKRNYYQEKLHFQGTDGDVAKIAYEYVLAIQWICHYYYNGVQSWSWYYPYHYAPFLSDLKNLGEMELRFDMCTPFLPYQQLLAVLPAASKECLPEPYWDLMCNEHSPIIDYYPLDFQCDLNGKQQEWEAVVLIPFINEERLLAAMDPCGKKTNKEESSRNKHSGCILYTHDSNLDYFSKSPLSETFPDIVHCKASSEIVPLHSWSTTDMQKFIKGLLPNCRLSVYYPGFPTLYHLPHKSYLKKMSVKVFQMPSKNENMILHISSPNEGDTDVEGQAYSKGETLDEIAKNILGTSVYVNWPHMEEAKAVAVSDGSVKYEVTEHIHASGTKGSKHKLQRKTLTEKEQQIFRQDMESVKESYQTRRGINVGRTEFAIYAQPLLGRKYVCGIQGQITLEKQWATKPVAYALQATVKDISVKDPTFQQFKGIEELLPTDSVVFMLGQPYYGCQGKVLEVKQGMASVEFETPNEPDIEYVIRQRHKLSTTYYAGWELASRLGISGYLVSRITGTIYIFHPPTRKWQLGLNLRFSRENSGVAGYTKVDNREWSYSEAVEHVLREYMEKFPEILRYLQSALQKNEADFNAETMVGKGKDVIARLQGVSSWLKNLDCYGGDRISEHSDMLESRVITAVEEKVVKMKALKSPKPVQITLRPHVLYRPLAHQGTLIPDKAAQHRLLDRIVNVRDGYTVPLGMRGTIIGIHRQPGQDILFDVMLDEEFLGGLNFGGRCPKRRGYRVPECAIINLSHGIRAEMKERKPTAVVRPQNKSTAQPRQAWSAAPSNQNHRNTRYSQQNREVTHRSRQRPNSTQQPNGPSITLMQRPAPKDQRQGQQPNMLDTLWNTLKVQNKNSQNSSSTVSPASSPAKTKNVPTSSSPTSQGKTAASQAKPAANTILDTKRPSPSKVQNSNAFNVTSLSQAAKSLPMVENNQNNRNSNNRNINLNSETNSFLSAALATPTNLTAKSANLTATAASNDKDVKLTQPDSVKMSKSAETKDAEHLDRLFKSIKITPQHYPVTPKLAFTPTQPIPSSAQPKNSWENHFIPNRAMGQHPPGAFPNHPSGFLPRHMPFNQPWACPPQGFQPPQRHPGNMYRPNLPPGPMNFFNHQQPRFRPRTMTYTHPSFLSSESSAPIQMPPPSASALFNKSPWQQSGMTTFAGNTVYPQKVEGGKAERQQSSSP